MIYKWDKFFFFPSSLISSKDCYQKRKFFVIQANFKWIAINLKDSKKEEEEEEKYLLIYLFIYNQN